MAADPATPLIRGETPVLRVDSAWDDSPCTLRSRGDGWKEWGEPVQGVFFLTNYQVIFEPNDGTYRLQVPLGTIWKVDSTGSQELAIDLHCRDVRILKFRLHTRQHTAKYMMECFQIYVFPKATRNLFCFFHLENWPNQQEIDGWGVYDPVAEYVRQGVPSSWRVTKCNADYSLCDTYPRVLVVPSNVSDADLWQISLFRSKGRIPMLSWIHPDNLASITRCSQPRVGFAKKRCDEDEKMCKEILRANPGNGDRLLTIIDARPKINATANRAKGFGYEFKSHYPDCVLHFVNIGNIHVMRESYSKVAALCYPNREGEGEEEKWLSRLDETGWLEHLTLVISGASRIVRTIEEGSSVLVHCSDGWDRTSQLSSLAMLLLDPFYRTLIGFETLIEKEWLNAGHKFEDRIGFAEGPEDVHERSPTFVQWVDCVWQIMQQFPVHFEFNEDCLLSILDHLFSCRFGTFLYNTDRERWQNKIYQKTTSLWAYLNAHAGRFTNTYFRPYRGPLYPGVGVGFVKLWAGYFLRHSGQAPSHVEQNLLLNKRLQEEIRRCDFLEEKIDDLNQQLAALQGKKKPPPRKKSVKGARPESISKEELVHRLSNGDELQVPDVILAGVVRDGRSLTQLSAATSGSESPRSTKSGGRPKSSGWNPFKRRTSRNKESGNSSGVENEEGSDHEGPHEL